MVGLGSQTRLLNNSLSRTAGVGLARLGTGATGAIAGLAATALGVGAIANQVDRLDEIGQVSDRLGIPVKELSELQFAAARNSIAVGNVDTALQRMVRRLSEAAQGSGEAVAALEELNLNASELATQRPDQAFGEIARAMQEIPSQADRVRLAFKLFDTEGVDLVRILNPQLLAEAADEARRLGASFTDEDVRRASEFNAELVGMKAAISGAATAATSDLLPQLTAALEEFQRVQEEVAPLVPGAKGEAPSTSVARGVGRSIAEPVALGSGALKAATQGDLLRAVELAINAGALASVLRATNKLLTRSNEKADDSNDKLDQLIDKADDEAIEVREVSF